MQGRNRDADIDDGLVDIAREGRVGRTERMALKYTLPYVKEIASGKLLYHTGSSTQYSVTT